jgi:hypothetical protein
MSSFITAGRIIENLCNRAQQCRVFGRHLNLNANNAFRALTAAMPAERLS